MILDGHCHVASTDFVPLDFIEDVVVNVRTQMVARGMNPPSVTRLIDSYVAQNQDHQADRLVREMDAARVDRAVLLVPDFSERMTCPLSMEEMARRHHKIQVRHPDRFWVYLGIDPRHGLDGVSRLETLIAQYGFDGVKLYPPCGYSPSDPALYPYYEFCASRTLPVFLHTGPTVARLDYEPAHPLNIDRAARDFPSVNFILGHGGVTHVDICSYLAAYRNNIYLDLGGLAASSIENSVAHLNRLFRTGINHKIIFGTDWPLNWMSGGLNQLTKRFADDSKVFTGVSRQDRSLVLSGNLLRVLPNTSRQRIDRSAGRALDVQT